MFEGQNARLSVSRRDSATALCLSAGTHSENEIPSKRNDDGDADKPGKRNLPLPVDVEEGSNHAQQNNYVGDAIARGQGQSAVVATSRACCLSEAQKCRFRSRSDDGAALRASSARLCSCHVSPFLLEYVEVGADGDAQDEYPSGEQEGASCKQEPSNPTVVV